MSGLWPSTSKTSFARQNSSTGFACCTMRRHLRIYTSVRDVSPSCRTLEQNEQGMYLPPEDVFGSMFHWKHLEGLCWVGYVAQKCTRGSPTGHARLNMAPLPIKVTDLMLLDQSLVHLYMHAFVRTSAGFRTSSEILHKSSPQKKV